MEGFWIGCVERHSQYLFDEDLFMFFDYLQKFNPGSSLQGFLHTLEEFSAEKNRVRNRYYVVLLLTLIHTLFSACGWVPHIHTRSHISLIC